MNVSQTGIELIKKFEDLARLGKDGKVRAYRCPAGRWTVGWGHTKGVRSGSIHTKEECEALLLADIGEFEEAIDRLVTVELTQSQYDALASFVFNVGEGNFASSTLLKKLNAGEYNAVPEQLLRWNKAKVDGKLQVLAGLTRRRTAEAALWAMDTKFAGNGGPKMVQKPVAAAEKSLAKSRTMMGASIAGAATVFTTTADQMKDLIPYNENVKLLFVAITLLGIGLAAYARWDDHRQGAR